MTTRIAADTLARCLVLAGPTASGKTALGIAWAHELDAEIVALDSMSLYRGMDIGTAKATRQEQSLVPHHLLDVIEPHQEYSVAEYVEAAAAACETILARGRVPLFVGGTGLYLRAILRGVFEGPPADWALREDLEKQAAAQHPDWLWQQLDRVDPVSASRLHPHDTRRLVRAIEVHTLTGQPLSVQQQEHAGRATTRPLRTAWLSPPRAWLYERINSRVNSMVDNGLLEEVAMLIAADPPPGRSACQALGYKEIIDHLEGRCSLEEAVDTIKRHTRRFARKQTTWFRNLEECHEIAMTGTESTAELMAAITAIPNSSPVDVSS